MRKPIFFFLILFGLQGVAFAEQQTIHVVTVNNNEDNPALPDSVPYNEVLIDWSAWSDEPAEIIDSCYIWGPWNSRRDLVCAGGVCHVSTDIDWTDIAGTSSNQFDSEGANLWTLDGEACLSEDDCYPFVDDSLPGSDGTDPAAEGVAPAAKVTVCDSDPTISIPDCGLAPEGPDLYTPVARDSGTFHLVCLRESAEGLEEVNEGYSFPPPTLEVSCEADPVVPQYICTTTTNYARSVSITNCGGQTVTFSGLSGGEAETHPFSCPLPPLPLGTTDQVFGVSASNGFSGPDDSVTVGMRLKLCPPAVELALGAGGACNNDAECDVTLDYRVYRSIWIGPVSEEPVCGCRPTVTNPSDTTTTGATNASGSAGGSVGVSTGSLGGGSGTTGRAHPTADSWYIQANPREIQANPIVPHQMMEYVRKETQKISHLKNEIQPRQKTAHQKVSYVGNRRQSIGAKVLHKVRRFFEKGFFNGVIRGFFGNGGANEPGDDNGDGTDGGAGVGGSGGSGGGSGGGLNGVPACLHDETTYPWVRSISVSGIHSGDETGSPDLVCLPATPVNVASDADASTPCHRQWTLHQYKATACDFDGQCYDSEILDVPYSAPRMTAESAGETCGPGTWHWDDECDWGPFEGTCELTGDGHFSWRGGHIAVWNLEVRNVRSLTPHVVGDPDLEEAERSALEETLSGELNDQLGSLGEGLGERTGIITLHGSIENSDVEKSGFEWWVTYEDYDGGTEETDHFSSDCIDYTQTEYQRDFRAVTDDPNTPEPDGVPYPAGSNCSTLDSISGCGWDWNDPGVLTATAIACVGTGICPM